MGAFITGRVRIEQTYKRRIYSLLENCLFMDEDNTIYLVPRTFASDGYTIPLWVDVFVGGGFDYCLRPALHHDIVCACREAIVVNLTFEELIQNNFITFDKVRGCWICKDIPAKFLSLKKFSKKQANDLLWRAMCATNIPLIKKLLIRLGVCFNIGWYIDYLLGRVRKIDLDEIYDPSFWDFVKGK